jgi:hypothetical protein
MNERNYIAKSLLDLKEYRFDTLKDLRRFVRSTINSNEIKGIEEVFEIYKEVTKRKLIDQAKSNPKVVGHISKVL